MDVTPDPEPCRCHQSFAYITPWHDGHCCFANAAAACHPAEVGAWVAERDRRSGIRSDP